MDADPAPSLKRGAIALALLGAALAMAGFLWSAWDMAGPARRPMLQGWDDSFYYHWLPSVILDGDVDFSNQLANSGTLDASARDEALAQPRTPTGLVPNKYPPGWALASLPFFLLAHAFAPANATGFEPVYLVGVWLGQLFYAFVGLWLAVLIVARAFPRPLASVAVMTTWLASPLVYYQTARLTMSHSLVFALAMVVFWSSLRIRDGDQRARQWFLLGLAAALLVVTRNLALVYLVWPAWVLARKLRSARAAGWLVVGAIGPVLAQLVAWRALYGSWFVYSYGGERFDFTQFHLIEVLFSPRHGWFYWHPVLLAGVAGFIGWGWRRSEGRGWMVSLFIATLLNAAWPIWWLGSSFGHRGFEVATLFAALGTAALLQMAGTRGWLRRAVAALLAAAIAWNLTLLALFLTQRIPREEPVTYAMAARALADWLAALLG